MHSKISRLTAKFEPCHSFARIGGEELASKIGKAVNGAIVIDTITGCAKTFRSNIKTRLKRDLNLVCEDQDVLVRDEQGYHLNDEKITVRDGTDDGDMDGLNDRQKWVLAQTGKGQDVTRARLEESAPRPPNGTYRTSCRAA